MERKPKPMIRAFPPVEFPKSVRANLRPELVLRELVWRKDTVSGLCVLDQTCSHTATFVRQDRPRLEELIGRAINFATQCRARKMRIDPVDIERIVPALIFPDHLLQDIIDAPKSRTAKQWAVIFYAEITGKTTASIERDLFSRA